MVGSLGFGRVGCRGDHQHRMKNRYKEYNRKWVDFMFKGNENDHNKKFDFISLKLEVTD